MSKRAILLFWKSKTKMPEKYWKDDTNEDKKGKLINYFTSDINEQTSFCKT